MIKKYLMIIAGLLVIIMFTSTSSASFLLSEEKIYELLPENSSLKKIIDRLSQIASDVKDSISTDTNDEYYDGNDVDDGDVDDGDVDDGKYDDDFEDSPEENVILPKTGTVDGEITPDNGNDPVDDSDENTTIETTIDPDSDDETIQDEWTVDYNGEGGTLERFVKIVTEINGNIGAFLERVIERTVATDENGISSQGSDGSAENNVVDVVVEGGSVGTSGADIADNIVLTDAGQ